MRRFLVLLFLVAIATGCDGHTSVKGRVVDEDGKPVAGAKVEFKEDGPDDALHGRLERKTDEQGQFSVALTHAPSKKITFTLSVSKEGFETFRETVTSENRNQAREITLARKVH